MDKNISEIISIRFNQIKEIRLKIKNKIKKIQEIKDIIKKNYINYISKEKKEFFGLDSFHFQNKVIELEHDNMLKLYHFIDNRIYGDYYKLFVLMIDFFKKTLTIKQFDKIKELKNIERFPIYKDLEPYKKYEFDIIDNVHQDIILIITSIKEIYKENELVIKDHKKQLVMGINIDNYIINQQFINNNLSMRNQLYENYLTVYHNYHHELLNKYYEKLQLFFKQINHHIVNDVSSTTSSDDEYSDRSTDSPKINLDYNNFNNEEINNQNKNDISQNILKPLNKENFIENNKIENSLVTIPEIDEEAHTENITESIPENIVLEHSETSINSSIPIIENTTSEQTNENSDDKMVEETFQPVTNKKKRKRNKKKNN